MPGIQENREKWNSYHWSQNGDEWSTPWGSSNQIWWGHLFPRIGSFLPAASILEIAPGFGRWTRYLKQFTSDYVGVDVAEEAVTACNREFPDLKFFHNNGFSLPMVGDRSISFCFSYDSLVHANRDVMKGYITELDRILTDQGAAFLHHSNLGAYKGTLQMRKAFAAFLPSTRMRRRLKLSPETHWRDPDVTAELVRDHCASLGLSCRQELISWIDTDDLQIDCLSLITRAPMKHVLTKNAGFGPDAKISRLCFDHYENPENR
jgi:SAM-dependent methyltransferase